ncbi:MAG: hypothetical protein NTW86_18050 [Candidatus Sumerlaeota bacterium]|nr:hypothetical protein [Candidatus Sumerlaeota bacterium]
MKHLWALVLVMQVALAAHAQQEETAAPCPTERSPARRAEAIAADVLALSKQVPKHPAAALPAAPQAGPSRSKSQEAAPTQTLSDDFNDGLIDTALWSISGNVTEQGGALHLSSSSGAGAYAEAKTSLMGADQDVEVSVDYSNLTGMDQGAAYLYMQQGGYQTYGVLYLSGVAPVQAMFLFQTPVDSTAQWISLSGSAGRLKIVHHYATGVVEGLVDEGAGWVAVGNSGSLRFDTAQSVRVEVDAYNPSSTTTVAFDNFFAQGGQYVPPQLGDKGLFEDYTYFYNADQRDVRMVVPANYDPGRPIGILFGFHGSLGSTPQPDPYLEYLLYSGYEARAARGYFITASMSNRKKTDGWSGGWTNNDLTSGNRDAQAVLTLYNTLKAHYAIDDDRIFITGFSAGANFSLTLPVCLPDFVAVTSPGCPTLGALNLPPAGARHACIGTGGLTDTYNTDTSMRNVSNWHRTNATDADCYVFDMPHSGEPADPTVTPPRPWEDIALDYFLTHPRGYATIHYPPPFYADDCQDEFSGSAGVPSAADWRVELFDGPGVMYGPVKTDGSPGVGVYGYKFRQEDGWLHSEPVGTGLQGGICAGRFLHRPSTWETAFVANTVGADLIVWPAILRDMTGRCVALQMTGAGWQWVAADTHLALRSQHGPSLHTLARLRTARDKRVGEV